MSLLVISDVHADIEALEAICSVVADKRFVQTHSKVENILNLGDTVERGYHPREVVERLRALQHTVPVVSLLGNHDEALLFGRPVSGSDTKSRQAHALCADCAPFLRTLPHCYLDVDNRIIAVHGGPIDPRELGDGWLFERSWQRIASTSYLDASGYHYTPEAAFRYVKRECGGGYVILCGHEHEEAAYSDRAGDLLEAMHAQQNRFAGYEIRSRWVERDRATSYLIRVGIAGPEGYRNSVGLNGAHFGLVWHHDKREKIGLFSFPI
jgi:hypothetical protein